MADQCPWCFKAYDITPVSEQRHLLKCEAFQGRPIAEWQGNKPYVRLPEPNDYILVQKTPIARRATN